MFKKPNLVADKLYKRIKTPFFNDPPPFIDYERVQVPHVKIPNAIPHGPPLLTVNPFPNKPLFLRVCCTSLLKTLWEKEKLLVTSNFSFSHRVFYPVGGFFTIFINFKIFVCNLFQFGRV